MSARIIVYVRQGVVESVDVESVEELVTDEPEVVVVDHANRQVIHGDLTAYVVPTPSIDANLLELLDVHGYTEVISLSADV